jgi:hypothetical protein
VDWVGGDWDDPDAIFEVKIAFYDGGDPGGMWGIYAGGAAFREMADDDYFDISIDIRYGEICHYNDDPSKAVWGNLGDFIMMWLADPSNWAGNTEYKNYLSKHPGDYSKIKITDVFIFDHGEEAIDEDGTKYYGIQIGDKNYWEGTSGLTNFCNGLGAALEAYGPNAVINFRGCNIAYLNSNGERSLLQSLASETSHTVTGGVGGSSLWTLYGIERSGPDYWFSGGVYQATPGGQDITEIWFPEFETLGGTNCPPASYAPPYIYIANWGSRPY